MAKADNSIIANTTPDPLDKVMWPWDRGSENHLVNKDSIHSSSEASKIPSSSSDQQEQSEPLSQELQCPFEDCSYKPTGKPENFKAYLRKHISTHLAQKLIKCDKEFARKDNLAVHRRQAHKVPLVPRRQHSESKGLELELVESHNLN
ncbi:hypothetical protein M434DRAFT_155830 [Hypoxylon sp. CO27-5]|nr:hypothetical protein M434DRAFT_155830 [Hypoxylon sp. CO27-5]